MTLFFINSLLYLEILAINAQQNTQNLIWKKWGVKQHRIMCFLVQEHQDYKEINEKMDDSQPFRPVWNNSFCKHQTLVRKS